MPGDRVGHRRASGARRVDRTDELKETPDGMLTDGLR